MNRLISFIVATLAMLAAPAFAQTYVPVPATPNISITSTSSAIFTFPGQRWVDWIAIKNDCSSPIYFDLTPPASPGPNISLSQHFNLRLDGTQTNGSSTAAQTFSGPFVVYALAASAASGAPATCTFTLQGGRAR